MVQVVPRPARTTGRKKCYMCDRRINSGECALRCSEIEAAGNPMGKIRYWLCWGCARDIDHAIKGIRDRKLGLKS